MKTFPRLFAQFQTLRFYLFFLFASPLLLLSMVALVSWKAGMKVTYLTRDLYQTTNLLPHVGFVSNIGVLMWCAAVTVCFFSWAILQYRDHHEVFSKFILSSGFITLILLLDDFFIIHETLRDYGGVPEELTFGVYAVTLLIWMIQFQKQILKTDYLILMSALGFFGLSLFIDTLQESIQPYIGHWRSLLEDGAKFMGIFIWFGYLSRCCFIELTKVHQNKRPAVAQTPVESELEEVTETPSR